MDQRRFRLKTIFAARTGPAPVRLRLNSTEALRTSFETADVPCFARCPLGSAGLAMFVVCQATSPKRRICLREHDAYTLRSECRGNAP
jgi:hypothetical protein